jgi:L-asparaginase/Glu-tRNA(Gln) amidotransferase subunit D
MLRKKERRIVLDLLETGKINSDAASNLLDALDTAAASEPRETVVFEIAADQDNLRHVVEKLNRAFNR